MGHPALIKDPYLSIVGRGELYPGDRVQVATHQEHLEALLLQHRDHPLVVVDGGVSAVQEDRLQLKCSAGKYLSFDAGPAIF